MEPSFWKEISQQVVITGGGLGIGGYILKRWLVKNMADDAAVAGAIAIKDQIIKELRQDKRELDAEWQLKWDRREKEYLEFRNRTQMEFKMIQKFNRDTQGDIRKLARAGSIDERDLDTQIYQTGMGPLDP